MKHVAPKRLWQREIELSSKDSTKIFSRVVSLVGATGKVQTERGGRSTVNEKKYIHIYFTYVHRYVYIYIYNGGVLLLQNP